MSFTVATWQQGVETGLFFFIGAVGWHLGTWAVSWLQKKAA